MHHVSRALVCVAAWVAAAASTGCVGSLRPLNTSSGTTDATDTGSTTGSLARPGPVIPLTAASTWFGTAGTVVELQGGPFPADAQFFLGGEPAEVLTLGAERAEVSLPALEQDAWLELSVNAPFRSPPAEGIPLRYFASAEGSVGAVGLVGRFAHTGGYWNEGATNYAFAEVAFPIGPAPHYGTWRYAPSPDSCALDRPPLRLSTYETGAEALTLVAHDEDGTEATLLPATLEGGAEGFQLPEVPLEAVRPTVHDLAGATGAVDWPEAVVGGFVGEPPTTLVVTAPAIMGVQRPSMVRAPTLRWGAPHDGEILVSLTRQRWDPGAGAYTDSERVTCWLIDDGEFALPDLWTDWAPWGVGGEHDDVEIVFGRVYPPESDVVMPHNLGLSGVLGGTFLIGHARAE